MGHLRLARSEIQIPGWSGWDAGYSEDTMLRCLIFVKWISWLVWVKEKSDTMKTNFLYPKVLRGSLICTQTAPYFLKNRLNIRSIPD